MKRAQLLALPLASLILAGCGSMSLESKRVDYKADAVKASSLEVPPDLTAPATEDHYIIPDGAGGAAANYSDYARSGTSPQARAAVLPETRNVRIERSGSQRWLVVNDKAESVWPVLKAFWRENGFAIKTENPQAGVMETDWTENRARISRSGLRSVLGKVLDGMYDSGEKDMYRVRLERSRDGGTEIYLSQYGMEEVLSADKSTSKWQSRPNDPELEATMLQLLMVKLGGEAARGQEIPVQAAVAAPTLKIMADGRKVIVLDEPFDQGWRKVGMALERAGIAVEDKDRAKGLYFLRVEAAAGKKGWSKLAFWRKDESASPVRYQLTVQASGAGCEVTVSNNNGASDATAQSITDKLYQNFGQ